MGTPSHVVSSLWFAGLLICFVGERLIGAGSWRWLTAAGLALFALAAGLRERRRRQATGERRAVERLLLGLYALAKIGLLLYFAQSDLAASLFGKPLELSSPRLQVVLAALYPVLLLAALLPVLLIELSYAAMARAPVVERGRVRDALLSGLGAAFALVFAFTFTYVATARDTKVDLSYFRTARVGEATRKIVMTLDQPVEASLFFPPANEVREQVESYFQDLAAVSKQIVVKRYDHAIDIARAKELRVTGNGTVILSRGSKQEPLGIGLELEAARSQLAGLDREIQRRLLQVARPQRTLYLVGGHGERTTDPVTETDKRGTVRDFREAMVQQGYLVRSLSAADGLASEVPADAALVLLLGPTRPLLVEESQALVRYVERGGRLFVALDPEAGLPMAELLAPLGLRFLPTLLANDQNYVRRTYQPSDRQNLATSSFGSHPAVATLGRVGVRVPLILLGAGAFEEVTPKPKDTTVDFMVHAHFATWDDQNGNWSFDSPQEARKAWELAAAVTRKGTAAAKPVGDGKDKGKPEPAKPAEDGRVLLLGDSDLLCDGIIDRSGSGYLAVDGMKWLLGDEATTGETESELDVPINHTRKQDVIWFYGAIFVAPGLALAAGFVATRRRRATRRRTQKEAA